MKRFLAAAVLVVWGCTVVWSEQPAGSLKLGEPKTVVAGPALAQARGAFGDGVYFVVWQDGWTGLDGTADIKGMRLKAGTLEPLDREPIAICSAADAQESPVVAFADGAFLVVWQDFRNGKDYDVRGQLIDARTGRPRGQEIEFAVRPGTQCRPAVASNGTDFYVAWQEVLDRDRHCLRTACWSTSGKLVNEQPASWIIVGSSPSLTVSADKVLLAWTVKQRAASQTAAVLLHPKTLEQVKDLGIINTCCGDRPTVAHDGKDGFMTAAARASAPDPWGWGGPGAVVLSRVQADGSTPESKLNYAYRLSNLCSRSVPNVVDAAVWKGAKTWEAGAVGGFQGTEDGLWPTGSPAVAYDGKGSYLFAWVKGTIAKDRLTVSNLDIWVRGMDAQTLAVRVADQKAAGTTADETHPFLINGPAGEILLLSEKLQSGEPRRLEARRLEIAK